MVKASDFRVAPPGPRFDPPRGEFLAWLRKNPRVVPCPTPSMLSQHMLVQHSLVPSPGTRKRVALGVASQL
jgi:hypothetical protein